MATTSFGLRQDAGLPVRDRLQLVSVNHQQRARRPAQGGVVAGDVDELGAELFLLLTFPACGLAAAEVYRHDLNHPRLLEDDLERGELFPPAFENGPGLLPSVDCAHRFPTPL